MPTAGSGPAYVTPYVPAPAVGQSTAAAASATPAPAPAAPSASAVVPGARAPVGPAGGRQRPRYTHARYVNDPVLLRKVTWMMLRTDLAGPAMAVVLSAHGYPGITDEEIGAFRGRHRLAFSGRNAITDRPANLRFRRAPPLSDPRLAFARWGMTRIDGVSSSGHVRVWWRRVTDDVAGVPGSVGAVGDGVGCSGGRASGGGLPRRGECFLRRWGERGLLVCLSVGRSVGLSVCGFVCPWGLWARAHGLGPMKL